MKIISYNVDGLPEVVDLMNLPKWLRFIGWIYKKIKGTSLIRVNDGNDRGYFFGKINSYLTSQCADVVVVQEHFDYPLELNGYISGTHTGGLDLSKIPSNMSLFPPRFKCDGLCIFTKYGIVGEDIVPWDKSYGYFSHCNDRLVHKGFRRYRLYIGDSRFLDVYNVHMDADHHDGDSAGDIRARCSQIDQLVSYVKVHSCNVPVVIIGDTNSYSKFPYDVENIRKLTDGLGCVEILPENGSDCDRVFTIGIEGGRSRYELGLGYSDHKPLIFEFEI